MILIDTNAPEISKQFARVPDKQLPYASALALTRVAAVGMREARVELGSDLVIRNAFSASGIQTNRAEKSDWPFQHAEVGIEERRDYLVDQVLGAQRKPQKAPFKGVPQTDVVPRGPSGKMPQSRRPGALIALAAQRKRRAGVGYYLVRQGGRELLFQRVRGAVSRLAYAFAKKVGIEPKFKFEESVERAVRANYVRELTAAIDKAIDTQR